jgi:hypothetical protein
LLSITKDNPTKEKYYIKEWLNLKQREPMKKLNIPENPDQGNQQRISQMVDAQMELIDQEVDKAMVEIIRELGYDVSEGMELKDAQKLHKKMQEAGHYITLDTEQDGLTYIVKLQVVQLAKTLKFELGGGVEEE